MVQDAARQRLPVTPARHEIAPQMAGDKGGDEPEKERCRENPGEEEMDDAAGRKILIGRQRRPSGEAAIGRPLGRAAHAEQAGRLETVAEDGRAPLRLPIRSVQRIHGQNGIVELEARLGAEIELRMRVEDLQPAQEQEEERDRPQPVGEPCHDAMPVDEPPFPSRPSSIVVTAMPSPHSDRSYRYTRGTRKLFQFHPASLKCEQLLGWR